MLRLLVIGISGRAKRGQALQRLQRTKGKARCALKVSDGRTVLAELHQSGSSKIKFPRIERDQMLQAVLLNTAGGVTSGDHLHFEGEVAPGGRALFTSQASERAYRAKDGPALITSELHIQEGAYAAWLPQETILFNGADLERSLTVHLAQKARFLAHETLLFGRSAMGEEVQQGRVIDSWRIYRQGNLVHAEDLRLEGPLAEVLDRPALAEGARALSTLVYLGEDAVEKRDAVRSFLEDKGAGEVEVAASAWNGKLILRLLSGQGLALRRVLLPLIALLNADGSLPRVWVI